MNREKQKYALLFVSILIVIIFLLVWQKDYYTHHMEKSPLYLHMSSYRDGSQEWSYPEDMKYNEGSGEAFFVQGMESYSNQDYSKAQEYFKRAIGSTSNDAALIPYAYFYMNQCEVHINEVGNEETVALTLEAVRNYEPLIDDTVMLWNLINSLSVSAEKDACVIGLLEEHINKAEHYMSMRTRAWIKNYIGMLQFCNQDFAKSLRSFYDVETTLEQEELTPDLKEELVCAKAYIANIYYSFEDYGNASQLYHNLIDMTSEAEVFYEYCACINMASAYLEIYEIEKAKEAINILEDSLPRTEYYLQEEIKASMNDVLANICLLEEDFENADEYLKKAEGFYELNRDENAFIGGRYFVLLTRGKYLTATGALEEAQKILEELATSVDLSYYGLEEEVYKVLLSVYQATKQSDKEVEIYKKLLLVDEEFTRTVQKEYMEFASYYRENNQLKESNSRLSRDKLISLWSIFIITLAFFAMTILVKLMYDRNITDQLTGVFNRKILVKLKSKYKHKGTPENFGVLMMDIDYFKKYNDNYGHPAGDEVLKKVAKVLKESVRSKDYIIRYGGEEFLIIMNGVQSERAEMICQRIHKNLKDMAIVHEKSEVSEYVTLSMGLYCQNVPSKMNLEQLIEAADKNLYISKEQGRNRVTISTQ